MLHLEPAVTAAAVAVAAIAISMRLGLIDMLVVFKLVVLVVLVVLVLMMCGPVWSLWPSSRLSLRRLR